MTKSHLTPDQRATLAEIAARPGLSHGVVAKIFEDRTGRPVSRDSVAYLRRKGGYNPEPANRHLTTVERDALAMLVAEAGREVPCSEIAAQLREITGREVSIRTVWVFAVEVMGRRRIGRGRRSGYHTAQARIDALMATPKPEKPEPKVDRSQRIIRVGRAAGGHRRELP